MQPATLNIGMWNLFKQDRERDGEPQPLLKLANLETPLIAYINKVLKNISALVLFSIAEETVFERICTHNTMPLAYICIKCSDEFIGIVYKTDINFTDIKIFRDNVNGQGPGERIVTAKANGMAICMLHSYNREKTKNTNLVLQK